MTGNHPREVATIGIPIDHCLLAHHGWNNKELIEYFRIVSFVDISSSLSNFLITSRSSLQSFKKLPSKHIHHIEGKDDPGTVWNDPEKDQRHDIVVSDIVEAFYG